MCNNEGSFKLAKDATMKDASDRSKKGLVEDATIKTALYWPKRCNNEGCLKLAKDVAIKTASDWPKKSAIMKAASNWPKKQQ